MVSAPMPGIVGIFAAPQHREPGEAPPALTGTQPLRQDVLLAGPGRYLGALQRPRPPAALDVHRTDGRIAALYGHCYDSLTGGPLTAAAAADLFAAEQADCLSRWEGAFHLVILDEPADRLTIVNDRLAILPLYWRNEANRFSFAPRLKFLARRDTGERPDPTGLLFFLSIGHYVGSTTLLQDVNLLAPASVLNVDLATMTVHQRRYWNLFYEPDEQAGARRLARRLGKAIIDSVELLTGSEAGRGGIFLSGGWDSRGILGASLHLDRPPALVVTNGKSDQIPGSDTFMARRMARDLDLPYRFCRRDPEVGPERWLDGIRQSELSTDNTPENYGQHILPADFFQEIDYILKGDVTWGSGDPALNHEMAVNKVLPYPLAETVKSVLVPDLTRRADELYEAEIENELTHCRNRDWTDRRDWLWQISSINRYILGLGYADEMHLQVRRPLLTGKVFQVYTQVPPRLRVQKNLFLQSLQMFFPRLFAYGRNHVSNIANYYAYMAPFIRERTLAHLRDGHDLDGLLDREACTRVIEAFQPGLSPDRQPTWKRRLYNRLHDRYGQYWHRSRFYREKPISRFSTSDNALAFRLFLLLEWYHGQRDLPPAG